VTYKNISGINLRIIELTPEFKKSLEANTDNNQLGICLLHKINKELEAKFAFAG